MIILRVPSCESVRIFCVTFSLFFVSGVVLYVYRQKHLGSRVDKKKERNACLLTLLWDFSRAFSHVLENEG